MSLTPEHVLDTTPSVRRALRQRFDPWTWANEVAGITLPKAGRLSMRDRPFMRDVFRDVWPSILVIKGAQLGFSTTAMIRMFWMLTTWPTSAIYTFPTGSDVSRFTQARINPLITGSEFLAARIVDVNSVGVKQFLSVPSDRQYEVNRHGRLVVPRGTARSTAYFVGSASEKDAVSIDADLLTHDEIDLSNPQIIEQFESRLDASQFKWKFSLSTPRLPGAGVDRLWRTTDQRHWLIRCGGCGEEFELGFPGGPWEYSNIEPETHEEYLAGTPARYRCHRCGKTITDENRLNGRWVSYEPGHWKAHGYQVSQMAAVWVKPEQVLKRRHEATWEADFWNLVMGIAWESETMGFSRLDLIGDQLTTFGLTDPERPKQIAPQPDRDYRMGIDPGGTHDWVMDEVLPDGSWRTVGFGTASDWDELDTVVGRWLPKRIGIDAAFDPTKCREFADKWNSVRWRRVWLVFYGGNAKVPLAWDTERGFVTAERTAQLSRYADARAAEPGSLPAWDASPVYERFVQHHVNSKKVPVWVKGLEQQRILDRYEWIEVGADHQFHASGYAMLAREVPVDRQGAPPVGIVSFKRSQTQSDVRFDRMKRPQTG